MSEKPHVVLGQRIVIGRSISAVVCMILPTECEEGEIQVVYLQGDGKAISKYAAWKNQRWVFTEDMGGYADNKDAFARFVAIFRSTSHDRKQ